MSKRLCVFDASPLIVLGRISQLSLIEKLCQQPAVPEAVAEEIRRGPVSDPARQWLQGQAANWIEETQVLPRVADFDLGHGESAVLSFALQHKGFTAILDERTARDAARSLGLMRVRGTLGLLLLAKRRGHLDAVRPQVEALLEIGFRVSESLLQEVFQQAGES